MADNTASAGKTSGEEGKNQNPPAGDSGRTFTQEEVNAMLAKERRDTQVKYQEFPYLSRIWRSCFDTARWRCRSNAL